MSLPYKKRIKELKYHQLNDPQLTEEMLLIQDIREQEFIGCKTRGGFPGLGIGCHEICTIALQALRAFITAYWIMIENKNKLKSLLENSKAMSHQNSFVDYNIYNQGYETVNLQQEIKSYM